MSRHVIVNDCLDPFDVETTGGKVSGHKIVDLPFLETVKSIETLRVD